MDQSPYSPPRTKLVEPPTELPDVRWLTNLLGLIVLLPGCLVLISLPVIWPLIAERFAEDPLKVVFGMVNAAVAISAGGLLIALRPLAVPALVISLVLGLASLVLYQSGQNWGVAWSIPDVAGLAYALWLRQRGALRSRPNNSSKPTPLRGAA